MQKLKGTNGGGGGGGGANRVYYRASENKIFSK